MSGTARNPAREQVYAHLAIDYVGVGHAAEKHGRVQMQLESDDAEVGEVGENHLGHDQDHQQDGRPACHGDEAITLTYRM